MKHIYLGVLFSSPHVVSSPILFMECTHEQISKQCGGMERQYSEGLQMDVWHLHALTEHVFVQYFNKADDFIRNIDLEGIWMEGEDLSQGMKEESEGN